MSRVRFELAEGDASYEVEQRDGAASSSGGDALITVTDPDGVERALRLEDLGGGRAFVALDGGPRGPVWFARDDDAIYLHVFGRALRLELAQRKDRRRARKRGAGGDLRTPMPGVITRVLVAEGDVVEAGAPLYGLEAMKMESLIKAPAPLRITAVLAAAGDQVEGGVDVVQVTAVDVVEDAAHEGEG